MIGIKDGALLRECTLRLLVEAEEIPKSQVKNLMNETNEIVAMTVSSIKTLRRKKNNSKAKV